MAEQQFPDQNSSDDSDINLDADSEYLKLLTQWMFLDRGDSSVNSAHAHHAFFLSID